MDRINKLESFRRVLVVVFFASQIAGAQSVSNPPPAPIPTQILAGSKVFISNPESVPIVKVPDLTYNEFYAEMKAWGRYTLVSNPADADLIFEVLVATTRIDNTSFFIGGGATGKPIIRMVIIDPKTHVTLWGLSENLEVAARDSAGRKNFDKAMSSLMDDLKKLTSASPAGSETAAPNR